MMYNNELAMDKAIELSGSGKNTECLLILCNLINFVSGLEGFFLQKLDNLNLDDKEIVDLYNDCNNDINIFVDRIHSASC